MAPPIRHIETKPTLRSDNKVGQAHTDVDLPSYYQHYDTTAMLEPRFPCIPTLFRSIIRIFIQCLINTKESALAVGYANVPFESAAEHPA